MTIHLLTWTTLLLPLLPLYLYTVRTLRFHHAQKLLSQHPYPTRAHFSQMTLQSAFHIHTRLVSYEFPTTFSLATAFALFKVYGISSISSVLHATGQFATRNRVDKRLTDTGCLLRETILNPPGSRRAIDALARINCLHCPYHGKGKIADEDMLFTLAMFALEPERWVTKYEWRILTDLERCAIGTMWKQLGEALGVNFRLLEGYEKGWTDGIEWLEDIERWSDKYQGIHMLPAESNREVADATLYHVVWKLPAILKPVGKQLFAAVLEDQLRVAVMLPRPPGRYFKFIHIFTAVRKFVLLYLTLPRMRTKKSLATLTAAGRMQRRSYKIQPWYVKPTIWNRWGLTAWKIWLRGGILPGDDGDRYFPDGFVTDELGPTPQNKPQREEKERLKLLFGKDVRPFFAEKLK